MTTKFQIKRTPLTLLSALIFLLSSFSSFGENDPKMQVGEGELDQNTYFSKELGWSIEIPTNWTILSKNKMDEYEQKGAKALEAVNGGEQSNSNELKYLINFQKLNNTFTSSSQPYKEEYPGEWEIDIAHTKKSLIAAYKNRGIKVDYTETTIEKIDGLNFHTYEFRIYGPKGNVVFKQISYSKLINDFNFGVVIFYSDENYKKELMTAWKQSKFEKKPNQD